MKALPRKKIGPFLAWWVGVATLAGIWGCSPPRPDEETVVVIGSKRIMSRDFKKDLTFVAPGLDAARLQDPHERKAVIERMINHYLILEYAGRNEIRVSKEEVQKASDELSDGYTKEAFQEALLRHFMGPDQWRRRLREQLLVRKVLRKVTRKVLPPSSMEMESYLREHRSDFQTPRMVKFRQIVTESEEEAENALKRLADGEPFDLVAKECSKAPEAVKGGEVGWVSQGELEKTMDEALFSLSVGEISPIVRSPYGLHIFQILAARPAGELPLPRVMKTLEAGLTRKRQEMFLEGWLKDLRKEYGVQVNSGVLKSLELG